MFLSVLAVAVVEVHISQAETPQMDGSAAVAVLED
jgi:UDP-3-O-acyl-N-acetylglucosamine deacetylase